MVEPLGAKEMAFSMATYATLARDCEIRARSSLRRPTTGPNDIDARNNQTMK